jgi:DNA-binding NarL/FixJ family response regulator
MKTTVSGSSYRINAENLDIKTLVTLVAEGHIASDMGILLIAKACNVDEKDLTTALRSVPKATRKLAKWTSEEEQTIIKMWNEGKTARQIGDALGRTAGSVGLRINSLRSSGQHTLISHESGRRKATVKA